MRNYDWNGNVNMPISRPDLTDDQVASMIRMLGRSDLNHEPVVTMARDRIMCLKKENAAQKNQLTELAEAANNMLTLLVDNKPIDGLYLSSIDEWDCLIKEVKS